MGTLFQLLRNMWESKASLTKLIDNLELTRRKQWRAKLLQFRGYLARTSKQQPSGSARTVVTFGISTWPKSGIICRSRKIKKKKVHSRRSIENK